VNERETEWASLMRAAIAGDAAAYERLLRVLAPALRSAARRGLVRSGRGDADVEDVVQETLLAIHLKRHTWDSGRMLGPWVMAIARNKLIDHLRRGGRESSVAIDDFADSLPAEDATPAAPARDVERRLATLPERQREVVRAISIDGASIRDTARRLEISEGAVRVALHRGFVALAAKLRDTSE
jgi:RNA polymerase sigma-70 factor (ECF subfamily)